MRPSDYQVDPLRAVLLIIDIQERLFGAMPEVRQAQTIKATRALIELARRFEIPVVVSQQYPKGLGPTVADIEACLDGLPELHRFDKTEFSACGAQSWDDVQGQVGRSQWLVAGMESHVCVYQTVRDLCDRQAQVFVCCDAVVSRTDENRQLGIDLMERCGAIPSSSETVVFDVLEKAGSDDFKALSKLIR